MSILTNLGRKLKMIAVPVVLGALAACATPFNANVQRFQSALPAPQGQTFTVVADDPALAGGLEFSQYAHQVADQMAHLGYTPVNSVDAADLVVRFDYGVDKGRERVRQTGFPIPSGARGTATAAAGSATAASATARSVTAASAAAAIGAVRGATASTIRSSTTASTSTPSTPAAWI